MFIPLGVVGNVCCANPLPSDGLPHGLGSVEPVFVPSVVVGLVVEPEHGSGHWSCVRYGCIPLRY